MGLASCGIEAGMRSVVPGKAPNKSYEAPVLRKPNREQAVLFLLGHAWEGNRNERELLDLIFRDSLKKDQARNDRCQ